jgi:hypothetical protein
VKEILTMFEKNTRVYIALGAGTVPGVVVGNPEPTTYTNRRGVAVRTMQVPVISRRELPGRDPWYQLSFETATLLSPRDTTEEKLDVTHDGVPMPLPELFALQRESLQAYLSKRQAQRPAETATA